MKKRLIMAKSVIVAMGVIGIAHAENTWTGFYAGVNAGFAFNNAQLKSQQLGFTRPSNTCNVSSNLATLFPGIQIGYMYQFPYYLIAGIEANVTLNAKQKESLSCICPDNHDVGDHFAFRNQMQNAIKGRVGRALYWNENILLPYLTTGVSFAHLGLTYRNEGGDYYHTMTSRVGWLIGLGVEWAFRQHWSLRAEYCYLDYGNAINLKIPSVYGLRDPNGNGRVGLSSNNVVVAINYWI